MNEELYELNVIDKPFCFPDEFQVIWKSQTCRINSFINRWERVKILICEFGLILFFWIWCMKRQYTWLSSTKGFRGLLLLIKWEGWIGKIVSVRWAWGKMKSGFFFLNHLAFNFAYVLGCQRKQSHPLDPGLSTLTIRPLCL